LWEGSAERQETFEKYDLKYSTKNLFEDASDGKACPLGLGAFSSQLDNMSATAI
jgi:hypothetical protein